MKTQMEIVSGYGVLWRTDEKQNNRTIHREKVYKPAPENSVTLDVFFKLVEPEELISFFEGFIPFHEAN